MLKYIGAYVATAVVFVVLDAGWLTLVAPRLYRPIQGVLLSGGVKIGPAIAFYLIMIGGLMYLAVRPALASGRAIDALVTGAVVGLVAYATYALTNHAIMKVWTPAMTLADMAWGTLIGGLGSTAGYFVARWLSK
ncbi:MAG: DUF2177 family protein [Alphaproteobacteria bacterium]